MPAITATSELTTNEREIHLMARLGSQQGQIEADEAAMIGKVFALNDLTARDLMVSRVATPSLSGGASLDSVRQEILEAADDAWWVVLGEEVDEVLGSKAASEPWLSCSAVGATASSASSVMRRNSSPR